MVSSFKTSVVTRKRRDFRIAVIADGRRLARSTALHSPIDSVVFVAHGTRRACERPRNGAIGGVGRFIVGRCWNS